MMLLDEPNQHEDSATLPPAPSQGEINAISTLLRQNDFAQAEADARALTQRFPENSFAWGALGTALRYLRRNREAVSALQRAVNLAPHDASTALKLANAFFADQRFGEAGATYERATQIQPSLAEAHFGLGNAFGAQGRLPNAAAAYRQALAQRPDWIEAHRNLGYTLMHLRQFADAEAHFREVVAHQPNDAVAYNSLGMILRGQKKFNEAEASYRQAVAISPQYAEAYNNLGNVLCDQKRSHDAEACYRHAVALAPNFAEAHFNLGNVLRAQGMLTEAEHSYQLAIVIKPQYLEAHNNLGLCLRDLSRLDEACRCFEAALAIKPDFLESHCNLASLKTYQIGDRHIEHIESLAGRVESMPTQARIRYWFAVGKIREDIGRYDAAFHAYAEGNQLQFAQFPTNEAADIALLAHIKSTFTADLFLKQAPATPSTRVPIFILGMPRSGTSLIEQILATYPDLYGAGELTELDSIINEQAAQQGLPAHEAPRIVSTLSADALRAMGDAYLERVWRLAPQATHITDKLPANFFNIGMIRLMFPQAKIIHAMRDPMDSCFSCYSRLFQSNNLDFTYDLASLGRYYVRYIELMQHWHQVLPRGTVLDVHYEALVSDVETQAKRLLDYLELPWDERCLAFHQNRRTVKTASVAQVRKPIYQSSVARWKHFEAHLAPLLDIVKDYR